MIMRMSFSGNYVAGFSVSKIRNKAVSFFNNIDKLVEIHNRLKNVIVENNDFEAIFDSYDNAGAFFYCDPPYVIDTRSGLYYKHEMDNEDHNRLVDRLLNLKGACILSGYNSSIYNRLTESGWVRKGFLKTICSNGITKLSRDNVRKEKTDSIWLSPRCIETQKQHEIAFMNE